VARTFVRNNITWLAYLLLALYGYTLNSFGPITPFLKAELNLSYTVSSLHFTAFAIGMVSTSLGGHLFIQRMGRWRSLWVGAFGMSLAAFALVLGRTPMVTISASFLMGLVGSLILVLVPSILSDQHGEMRSAAFSEANVISSLASTLAPLLVGWIAQAGGSWRLALGFGALGAIAMRLGFLKASLPQAGDSSGGSPPKGLLPARYWIFWIGLVLAVAVEFCMVFWSADYLFTPYPDDRKY
jgi:MFS family permease